MKVAGIISRHHIYAARRAELQGYYAKTAKSTVKTDIIITMVLRNDGQPTVAFAGVMRYA